MSAAAAKAASSSTASNAQPDATPSSLAAQPINPDPTEADLQRRKEIDRAWCAYRGEFPDVFKTPNGQASDNVRPNRCAAIVDKGVSWLFGKEFTFNVRPADATPGDTHQGNEKQAQALAKVWGSADDMLTTLTMLAMNGGISGHAFLKIVWDSQKMQQPRLSVLDSHNVYVLSDPDDINRAVCYVIEYSTKLGLMTNGQQRTVTKRQVIALVDKDGNARYGVGGEDDDDYWTITNWLRYDLTSPGAASSALSGQQQPWTQSGDPVTWPYPFPPIVDAMNLPNPNEFWGLPDLPPALMDLNERIHFVESNISKIIKSNAHPWIFASGCDPNAIRNEPGVVQGLPSPESKVWAVSATGDLASSMDFANDLRADMDEQSRVPAVALGRQESMPKGNLSGIALALLFQPLIEKTELKRRLYGQLVRRASAYCLVLMGLVTDWRSVEVDLAWPNLLPNDDLAMAQTAVAKQGLGFSQRTLIKDLGGDPDEEAENRQDEQQAQVTAFAQGKGMPPMPNANPSANMPPDASGGDSDGAGGQDATSQGASGQTPPINHPKAIEARQRVKAAFGKS